MHVQQMALMVKAVTIEEVMVVISRVYLIIISQKEDFRVQAVSSKVKKD